eukprot:TRINITY_DN8212_c0_g1_i2.p3 TRINITY_DN8212_c0_g1~~TRINITY_DN8212_c0_g1_i2.p3  ORF type:complete len:150 (+),score=21.85 TRINITY_DN8212_c0_g1_i2:133-582(+)
MCIRDRYQRRVHGESNETISQQKSSEHQNFARIIKQKQNNKTIEQKTKSPQINAIKFAYLFNNMKQTYKNLSGSILINLSEEANPIVRSVVLLIIAIVVVALCCITLPFILTQAKESRIKLNDIITKELKEQLRAEKAANKQKLDQIIT